VGCTGAPGEIPAPAAGYTCVTGNPLMSDTPGGPPWTGNVGVQYQWKLANGSSLTPRLDFTFRDHPPYGNSNEVFTDSRVKSQSLLNGRVTWVSSEGGWSVSAWGTNLADKDYILNYFDLRTAAEAQAMAQPGRPREWGVTLRKTF
jgi:iron complex outermembrane receptor protein